MFLSQFDEHTLSEHQSWLQTSFLHHIKWIKSQNLIWEENMLNIWLLHTKKCTYRQILREVVIGCVKQCLINNSNLSCDIWFREILLLHFPRTSCSNKIKLRCNVFLHSKMNCGAVLFMTSFPLPNVQKMNSWFFLCQQVY